MRIITGTAKGKALITLEGDATRPTSQRIKEAIFSAIQFDVENRRTLDLFAGSGQMGLEALSRGASHAHFIDISRDALEVAKKNALKTGLIESSKFLASDWRNYIRKASGKEKFDLVFVDPPYSMACCREAAKKLSEAGLLARGAIVVLESGEEDIEPESLSGYEILKSTHYGKKTFVNILLYKGTEDSE